MGFFDFLKPKAAPSAPSAPSPVKTTHASSTSASNSLNITKSVGERLDTMKKNSDYVSKLSITKGITNKSRVAFVLDYSGSFDKEYSSGRIQEIFERLFPIAMAFDDNQAVDLFAFHNTAFDLGEVTTRDFADVIRDKIQRNLSFGGTCYSPIIDMIVNKYKSEKGDPVYVVFLTDGDCSDDNKSRKSVIEASRHGIFFQFVGVGPAKMDFLEDLDNMPGRVVDNANFFQVTDISRMSDSDLYGKLMNEYPKWLKEAKTKNII